MIYMLLQQRSIPVKRLFEVGQREIKNKITFVTNKGEHSIFSQSKQILTR
jgi:hypothetical protein